MSACPADDKSIAQTAEAVGKSADLQKALWGFLKIFSTQAREENTIKQSTKRTTSAMREETCLCLRSEIGDRPSAFVPQGNRAKAQD